MKYLLYPDNKYKTSWELFITFILLLTCFITPLSIAFGGDQESPQHIFLNEIIDLFFLMDIFVNFNSAVYNEYMEIIDDRKQLAKRYLAGWFSIDVMAIFPFDLILKSADFNQLVRVARFGRLYKLIKLTRLLRILKILREKSNLIKQLNDVLKIGLGFERLFFFIMIFAILCHLVSCLFIIVASVYD